MSPDTKNQHENNLVRALATDTGVSIMTLSSILVVNTKGGCGKSTIATNLACYYRGIGLRTAVYDCDRQRSTETWLRRRPSSSPKIQRMARWEDCDKHEGLARLILDSPGGISTTQLAPLVAHADAVIVPVLPSDIDTAAAARFIGNLLVNLNVDPERKNICVVANRVRLNTNSYARLGRFLSNLRIPCIAQLRDTQSYVRAYECGLGLCELQPSRGVTQELEQWRRLVNWLERPKGETIWERAIRLTGGESRHAASSLAAR